MKIDFDFRWMIVGLALAILFVFMFGELNKPKPLTEKAFKAYIKQHNTKLDTRLHKMSEDTSKAIDNKFKDLLDTDQ